MSQRFAGVAPLLAALLLLISSTPGSCSRRVLVAEAPDLAPVVTEAPNRLGGLDLLSGADDPETTAALSLAAAAPAQAPAPAAEEAARVSAASLDGAVLSDGEGILAPGQGAELNYTFPPRPTYRPTIDDALVDYYNNIEIGVVTSNEWITITLGGVPTNVTVWCPTFPTCPISWIPWMRPPPPRAPKKPPPPPSKKPVPLPPPRRPSPPPPRSMPSPPTHIPGGVFKPEDYMKVLEYSFLFYEAQRSGRLPDDNRVPWRRSAHLDDPVVGGWYDAGDYIKHSLTIGQVVTYLSWAAVDFKDGNIAAGQHKYAKQAIKWAADYLRKCHISDREFIGLIADPKKDHDYWGRPEEMKANRKAYIWKKNMDAADLLGMASAALASASVALRNQDEKDADDMLRHAKQLYDWSKDVPGLYSRSYKGYPKGIYDGDRWEDKMFAAAAWLYRATGDASYLKDAQTFWNAVKGWEKKGSKVDPYPCYDSMWAPAAVLLISIGQEIGSSKVPGYSEYVTFLNDFKTIWIEAKGSWGIKHTPKGLRLPEWSKWGNLRYANNAAFVMLLRAKTLPEGSKDRKDCIDFARSQVEYAMGSAGRSFIVGWGKNPPQKAHHAGASCPDRPAKCDWAQFSSKKPNPQILYGAMVAGPAGPGDDTYKDERNDYVTNEVAIDYNSGLTGALAGLLSLGTERSAVYSP